MRRGSWARRLATSQLAALASMAVTVALTALVVGPSLFAQHMREAGHGDPMVLDHAERAFRTAGIVSLGVGLGVAAVVAFLTGWLVDRRLVRGLDALSDGAAHVRDGDWTHRVDTGDAGPEIARVAEQFNQMAATIATTESTRRRMLTDLAHELRTPLSVTRVTLEAVEDGVRPLDEESLAVLHRQNARLEALASSIGEVSAAEEGRLAVDPRPVSLDDLARAALDGWRLPHRDAGVRLVDDLQAAATVDADPARIGQVLDNLLRNALQHTPAGGTVALATRELGDGTAELTVTDDGAGIDPSDLDHVFERFYRADRSRQRGDEGGTGVGLAISRAIVRAHGGTITAASDGTGRGARFTVVLPLWQSGVQPTTPTLR